MKKNTSGKIFSTLLLLLMWTLGLTQPTQLMEEANAAYANKNYQTALETYEQILSEGFTSSVLHYNLGNAYFRTQQLGRAILHYEKARQLAPGDREIRHNLEVARALQRDDMQPLPTFFLSKWWRGLRAQLSATGWTTLGLFLLWTSAAGFLLWLLGQERQQRKRGFLVGVTAIVLCALPFSLAISRGFYDAHSQEAILLTREASLYFAPDSDSQVVLIIHEGLKLDLQDRISNWYKVRLPNGEIGWLPVEVVEEI